MSPSKTVRIGAVGDVTAFHEDPECAFDFVGPTLQGMDIVFGQNERLYSTKRDLVPAVGFTELTHPDHVRGLKFGNFSVISGASNHLGDLGPEVVMETIDALRGQGFAVIGAGANIDEARTAAVIERNGTRVGFLAYCSVLRPQYEATKNRPGVAPMRAHTHYEQVDYQPGTAPRILTFPDRGDMKAMLADIERTRAEVDVLAVSFHWGVHLVKGVLADYEREVAHAVIDAGVDIVIGHGPHILKAIEFYAGKPIFYSLGNFCFDAPTKLIEEGRRRNPEFDTLIGTHQQVHQPTEYDKWYHSYSVSPDSRFTAIAQVELQDGDISRVSFLPAVINTRAQPTLPNAGEQDFDAVVAYVREATASQGITTEFTIEGNEVVVTAG